MRVRTQQGNLLRFGDYTAEDFDREFARQHGRTPPLAVPELSSCASSGRSWRLWAAQHSQGERLGHRASGHCLG